MSGGERTMTAVALLLAVFKSRPGPFCLMDEVDAALDEANVDRFAGVLKEFSEKTQFILISHHKRTMASATVLHGITMKEPGISTRYSVDVEDYMSQKGKANDSGPLAA
jgi:chromosome segregation protein